MASCSPFDVKFSGSSEVLYEKLKKVVEEHGGTINGDASGGSVSIPIPAFGSVAGTYKISEQVCTLHITQRPFLLPCSTIESFIKDNIPTD